MRDNQGYNIHTYTRSWVQASLPSQGQTTPHEFGPGSVLRIPQITHHCSGWSRKSCNLHSTCSRVHFVPAFMYAFTHLSAIMTRDHHAATAAPFPP